jgi:chemotaxis response regulator CheB
MLPISVNVDFCTDSTLSSSHKSSLTIVNASGFVKTNSKLPSAAPVISTETTFQALNLGAVDYIPKPSGQISLDIEKVRNELVNKIKTAAQAKIITRKHITRSRIQTKQELKEKVITIGASTKGPPALEEILTQLPKNIPPTLIVQHMPVGFTKLFARRLDGLCKFSVKEAEEGDTVKQGQALIAPGGYHMIAKRNGRIQLDCCGSCSYSHNCCGYFETKNLGQDG